jgi:hypothetical protein
VRAYQEAASGVIDRYAGHIAQYERALEWFEERQKITLAPEQREAIRRAVASSSSS